MYLCRDTGAKANGDDLCPVHQTEECMGHFVETDPEWSALTSRANDAESVAHVAQFRLRKAQKEINDALRSIEQPRERFMGTYPALMPQPITDAMIEAAKRAWHEADELRGAGHRMRAALEAAFLAKEDE